MPNKGHKDTPTKSVKNNERQGHPPAESVPPKALSLFFSTESNPSHKPQQAQQHRAPAHPRPLQEMPNKGHKNTPTKTPMNDQGKGQPPTERMPPKALSLFFSTESKSGEPSHKPQQAQQHRAPAHPRPLQEMPNKGHKDTPTKTPRTTRARDNRLLNGCCQNSCHHFLY
ncbi:uncharacterized protein LACBIDRAFT_296098 [Laccaria bicolor S238N-H82]|uniref:Predicted protein n=1 Tax=Laccaria bicolor (strain S238N-H82 / ATCC MYA-4686) TaxID=486041 RepID=B0E588_LACBS|nr:uncharacterized protein LACBIDRAFT_296098 [Laccaria bicolor S238N-H82]EDQ97993.1 predicted protein [Laccaria bicolor S238N-H82]|eukprot:XP_001891356.1 predicted protein [Laccaria bicolor S238N-H82]